MDKNIYGINNAGLEWFDKLNKGLGSRVGGSLVTQKSESHMTAVCNLFSDCGSFQNLSDDTSPIFSMIKTSHAPKWSK